MPVLKLYKMAELINNQATTEVDEIKNNSTPHNLFFQYVESLSFDKQCDDRLHIRERNKKGDIRPSDKHSIELLTYFINQQLH